jgi:hypothetical protein
LQRQCTTRRAFTLSACSSAPFTATSRMASIAAYSRKMLPIRPSAAAPLQRWAAWLRIPRIFTPEKDGAARKGNRPLARSPICAGNNRPVPNKPARTTGRPRLTPRNDCQAGELCRLDFVLEGSQRRTLREALSYKFTINLGQLQAEHSVVSASRNISGPFLLLGE